MRSRFAVSVLEVLPERYTPSTKYEAFGSPRMFDWPRMTGRSVLVRPKEDTFEKPGV